MFERFTKDAKVLCETAVTNARKLGDNQVGTEHLLLAVNDCKPEILDQLDISLTDVVTALKQEQREQDAEALSTIGIDIDGITAVIDSLAAAEPKGWHHVPFHDEAKTALELALKESLRRRDKYIGVEHIFLGLLLLDGSAAHRALDASGVTHELFDNSF